MEVWALVGDGPPTTLQELLTVVDDMPGAPKTTRALVKAKPFTVRLPESVFFNFCARAGAAAWADV